MFTWGINQPVWFSSHFLPGYCGLSDKWPVSRAWSDQCMTGLTSVRCELTSGINHQLLLSHVTGGSIRNSFDLFPGHWWSLSTHRALLAALWTRHGGHSPTTLPGAYNSETLSHSQKICLKFGSMVCLELGGIFKLLLIACINGQYVCNQRSYYEVYVLCACVWLLRMLQQSDSKG